jgi:hypothetical protein
MGHKIFQKNNITILLMPQGFGGLEKPVVAGIIMTLFIPISTGMTRSRPFSDNPFIPPILGGVVRPCLHGNLPFHGFDLIRPGCMAPLGCMAKVSHPLVDGDGATWSPIQVIPFITIPSMCTLITMAHEISIEEISQAPAR